MKTDCTEAGEAHFKLKHENHFRSVCICAWEIDRVAKDIAALSPPKKGLSSQPAQASWLQASLK